MYQAFHSGYSLIHFDNRNNRRDPEWRDVYQVRLFEEGHIPWVSDSFKQAVLDIYQSQWSLCIQVLQALAAILGVSESHFFSLFGMEKAKNGNKEGSDENKFDTKSIPSPYDSQNTNLSLFRYFDKENSYTRPQQCMVHQDSGILTLIPKTDFPGLEILCDDLKQWIPIEKYMEDDEIVLFCGISLERITGSRAKALTHRVVRFPQRERYSMPFEMKPDDDAVLEPIFLTGDGGKFQTYDGLQKEFTWKKVMLQVARFDGIEPTTDHI